ncbi:MAG TPA: single-stranded DNA-binding protein [Roseiflexaceae bacterium]|nr:single-stranded DNA-binding protein [Roseiflexaceae bacterium]
MQSNGTVNNVELIGYLGADPEARYTANGNPVANFRIATNRVWRDGDGEQHKEVEWTSVVAWNKLAETCTQYLHRGSRVRVAGYLRTRSWEDDKGTKHYRTEVIAESVLFLDRRSDDQAETEEDAAEEIDL